MNDIFSQCNPPRVQLRSRKQVFDEPMHALYFSVHAMRETTRRLDIPPISPDEQHL
jgi:hypothetical protein